MKAVLWNEKEKRAYFILYKYTERLFLQTQEAGEKQFWNLSLNQA